MKLGPLALLIPVWLAAGGCVTSEEPSTTRLAVENVLTLRLGSVSELKERRGQGPFRTWPVSPERMLEVIESAARRGRRSDGRAIDAVWVSERYREVVAKEPEPGARGYGAPFLSAMVATVHPVEGDPASSRVEIHAMQRGPFHGGVIQWERDLPRWIDEVLAGPPPSRHGVRPIR